MTREFIDKNVRTKSGRITDKSCKEYNKTVEEVYNIYFPNVNRVCFCKSTLEFINFGKGYKNTCGLSTCISKNRSNKAKEIWDNFSNEDLEKRKLKTKETCLSIYGTENPMQNKDISKKTSTTLKSKTKNEIIEIVSKRKETSKSLYNNENYNNMDKNRATKLKNHNDANYNNSKKKNITKNKIQENGLTINEQWKINKDNSCIFLHGDKNYNNMDKNRATCLKKYGFANIMQTGLIPTGYKHKDYILPSGKIIKIQGYEDRLIDELLLNFDEEEILTDKKDMPIFWYMGEDNKEHRYFPDAYIPSTNTIYEVKSNWTMKIDYEKNIRKFKSVEDSIYTFELKIY